MIFQPMVWEILLFFVDSLRYISNTAKECIFTLTNTCLHFSFLKITWCWFLFPLYSSLAREYPGEGTNQLSSIYRSKQWFWMIWFSRNLNIFIMYQSELRFPFCQVTDDNFKHIRTKNLRCIPMISSQHFLHPQHILRWFSSLVFHMMERYQSNYKSCSKHILSSNRSK